MNTTTVETKFKEPKVCSCGASHIGAPARSKTMDSEWLPGGTRLVGGVFFQCVCESTLFVLWTDLDYKCLECFDVDPEGSGTDCVECCGRSGHEFDSSEGGYCHSCGEHPVAGNWNE